MRARSREVVRNAGWAFDNRNLALFPVHFANLPSSVSEGALKADLCRHTASACAQASQLAGRTVDRKAPRTKSGALFLGR
jgi:hypothetical protein